MALHGTVMEAADGARGFDADRPVSAAVAAKFAGDGYTFCARYLSRGTRQAAPDLTAAEAEAILSAGLALVPVQHVAPEGWTPTAALGTEYGNLAAAHAGAVGFPAGVNVWCDLEGVAAGVTVDAVTGYCAAWFEAVKKEGFVPGLYVGACCVLNRPQLEALPFAHFWKSCSRVPALWVRGYQMVQSAVAAPVHGLAIDSDVARVDALGRCVLWLAPA